MSSAVSSPFSSSRGPFKKYVTGLGGGWSSKIVTNCDKGEGVKPKSDVTTSKKYRFNNRIRMTLRVVIAPLHLLFNVAFHADNKKFASKVGLYQLKVCHYFGGDKEGGGSRQRVSKCDEAGKGVKNWWQVADILFEWLLGGIIWLKYMNNRRPIVTMACAYITLGINHSEEIRL